MFEVIDSGLLTTVQDLGRFGWYHIGMPPSGAMDNFSFRVGNLLVGNDESAAGLEQTARFLPKTSEQPAYLKDRVVPESVLLGKEAVRLRQAAEGKNVAATNEAIQQINLLLRSLRPDKVLEKNGAG